MKYTYKEAYKVAMAAGWDAMIRAGGGKKGYDEARETFEKVMAANGYPVQGE